MRHLIEPDNFGAQLGRMGRVITAMILREVKTRFGRLRFGVVWILVEPILFLGAYVALRLFLDQRVPFGQNMALFFLTGFLVVRTFSAISGRAMSAVTANRALLAYPPVKPVDVILARILLETLVMFVIWTIVFSLLAAFSQDWVIVHWDVFVEAAAVLVLLSASFGFFGATLTALTPFWERFWPMLRLPLMMFSGLFYVPLLMPPWMQRLMYWNPILHCVEWLRTATYLTYEPLLDKSYVILFALVTLALGLLIERGYRHVILSNF